MLTPQVEALLRGQGAPGGRQGRPGVLVCVPRILIDAGGEGLPRLIGYSIFIFNCKMS